MTPTARGHAPFPHHRSSPEGSPARRSWAIRGDLDAVDGDPLEVRGSLAVRRRPSMNIPASGGWPDRWRERQGGGVELPESSATTMGALRTVFQVPVDTRPPVRAADEKPLLRVVIRLH